MADSEILKVSDNYYYLIDFIHDHIHVHVYSQLGYVEKKKRCLDS